MSKTQLLAISFLTLLISLAGCKTSKLSTATEVEQKKPADRILYHSLTNFPAANHWASNSATETPLVSAHRGRPELEGYVENSLEAISKLIASGSFILELDVAKSKDGVLFLFHDYELDRLTRNTGDAADRTWAELDTMRLIDKRGNLSNSTIPTLEEALRLANGKAMFTLDRKRGTPLAEISAVVKKLDMHSDVALILYNMDDFTEWANQKTLGPISHEATDVLELEQLAQRCRELYKRVGIPPFDQSELFPNSGFVGVGLPDKEILAVAKTLGIKTTVGTFGDLDQQAVATDGKTYRDLVEAGVSIIATNKPLLAHKALYGQ
ncbi:MAG: glycerophosphodiester phosphodiesterase family protein [Saprospiraceae bacterium]